MARNLLNKNGLFPKLEAPFKLGNAVVGGTHFATNRSRRRVNRRLDTQVIFPVLVDDIPVVGGGGDFTAVLGHQSSIIGFSGVWRPVIGSFEAKLIPQSKADSQFRAITKGMKIESFSATLAYYSAPAFSKQDFLYPVYVYRAIATVGNRRVPLRNIMLYSLLLTIRFFILILSGHKQVALENVALRHQLAVFTRERKRPQLRDRD